MFYSMKKIVIAKMPVKNKDSLVTVCYEDGRPVEFFVRPEAGELSEGSIFTGTVEKVDERLGAAFVRIGKDTSGYLPLKKAKNIIFAGHARENGLKPNDRILVMVEKAAVKTKHCVLTTDLAVSGKYLVLHSDPEGRITCSRKLAKEEAKRLSGMISEMFSETTPEVTSETIPDVTFKVVPEKISKMNSEKTSGVEKVSGVEKISGAEEVSGEKKASGMKKAAGAEKAYGVTVRTLAAEAEKSVIRAEYESLKKIMDRVTRFGVSRPGGTCLYAGNTPEADMLKRIPDEELSEAVTDSEEVFESLTGEVCPMLDIDPARVRLYREPSPDLYKLYNFSTLLARITSEKVNLKSGGTLNIESTEAFVVIDVNSANSTKKYKNAESFLPLNLEAADEIAAQIRLRQLSGIILIDFVNMRSAEEEKKLIAHFKALAAMDPVRTNVVDITPLGIMEVTREKRYRSIDG